MAAQVSEAFREEHRELMVHVERIRDLARELRELPAEKRKPRLDEVLAFIANTLVPHAGAEEAVMYPEVGRLLGASEAPEPMVYDHRAIRERAAALERTDPADAAAVEELLYGLHALIVVHFEKEEQIYLPLLESQPEAVARSVFERMDAHGHGHHGGGPASEPL